VSALPFRSVVAVAVPCTKRKRKIELDRMNGNGKLTETEKVNFYVSYGILADHGDTVTIIIITIIQNLYSAIMPLVGYRVTDERKRNAGSQT